ncbi:MAG: nuclear transport factor 2 family protein [Candidatus Sulfotelmatobacter sp.]
MWKLLLFLLLSGFPRLGAQTAVQPDAGQSRILALENGWNQAVQQKDAVALDMLLGIELVYVDYDGKLMDKAAYLASVQSSSLHPTRIVSEFMKVYLYGPAAVVSGEYRENGLRNGKPYLLRERFTDTWVRGSERWVCVASHSTLIAP